MNLVTMVARRIIQFKQEEICSTELLIQKRSQEMLVNILTSFIDEPG
jgi:hypothetical protein